MSDKIKIIDHLIAIIILPFMVVVVIPFLLKKYFSVYKLSQYSNLDHGVAWILGLTFFIPGVIIFLKSVKLFHQIGNGTLAPWKPTQNLVVKGLYTRVRNPMIIGVILLLISASLFYNSTAVFLWMCFFFISCNLFFILFEEPDLERRFGDEYKDYKSNVPRWIPSFNAWYPVDKS